MIAVAIDGPAGAGKSTIARRAAKELGFVYVDTGALYRAVGLFVLRAGAAPSDRDAVRGMLEKITVTLCYRDGEQRVILCGNDVTDELRSPEVSKASSAVSAFPEVRGFLLSLQRELALRNDVVMDGRDIGTVVLPGAQVKIFLTAAPEDRARRRYEEMRTAGKAAVYDEILADLKQRDYNDTHRAVAPLVPAGGAVRIDTTGNTLEQSVEQVTAVIKKLLPGQITGREAVKL